MILYSKHIILEDREFDGFLELQDGKIKGLHSAWDGPYRDFRDQVILPGFIDIHIHGWATGSFWFEKAAGAVGEMCRTLPYAGVTSFLATSGADTIPEIKRCIAATRLTRLDIPGRSCWACTWKGRSSTRSTGACSGRSAALRPAWK